MTDLCQTDLPTSHKVELAVFALATQGTYGAVTQLAENYEVSRPTVYAARDTGNCSLVISTTNTLAMRHCRCS